MSDPAMMVLVVLELAGLVGFFVLMRRKAKRPAGQDRPPRPVRIATALLGLLLVVGFIRSERQHEKLVKTGTPATAIITRIEETGTVINQQPQVQVWMTVEPQGEPAFTSQSTWVFSVTDVQNYRVGTKVNVFYDPEDHEAVAVVGVAPSGS